MSADIDLAHLRGWVGRGQTREQELDLFPARALAALLDRPAMPQPGDELPLAWHWMYFLDTPRRTGADGHPERGDFLPPVALPRRMWAGGDIDVAQLLRLGDPAQRTSTVHSVDLKHGRSGPLVFVTVVHELSQNGRTCVVEQQHLVYRGAAAAAAEAAEAAAAGERAAQPARWTRRLQPDPPLLFRYSALTYNGHRIHYDREYATRVEHYPALVVHGPLIATLLLDLAARACPQAHPSRFSFRARRPAFDGEPLQLCGAPSTGGIALWSTDSAGIVGMTATLQEKA